MKNPHSKITNLKQKLFSTKQRVTISILVFLFVGIGISFTYDYFAKGATYGWIQSSWSGNADITSTANHTNNQNNWNKFFSKNDNISANTEITLNSTNLTKTDTTTANFQTGTNTNGTYPILNTNNELKLDIPCTPPTQPSTITGNTSPCRNTTGLSYNVTNIPGTTYTWTVPTGWSITAGQTTNSITVTASTTSGNISVTPSNSCGSGTARTLAVSTTTVPSAAGVITGTTCIAQGQSGVAYSITAVSGATGYTWNYTGTGFSIATGTNTRAITADFSGSATSGNLTVTPTNACGNGTPRNVSLNPLILAVGDVFNPTTCKVWMDRNLGATQIATSSTDVNSYGDLYQWGRGADGHQISTSGTTTDLSNTDSPGHGNFILAPVNPKDWRSPQNDSLWQGVTGVNNPCPTGYRIPTSAELNAERATWSSQDHIGAFNSPLKLPVAGGRDPNGLPMSIGSRGIYWSSTVGSTVAGPGSSSLIFFIGNAYTYNVYRADSLSVRCIKD